MIQLFGGRRLPACAALFVALCAPASRAAEPPLKIIVPYVPGGAVDGTALRRQAASPGSRWRPSPMLRWTGRAGRLLG
ncbi:hypothetical protein [uncultured Pigmentiphaga sp.]|uniref:hypothetical protein n=1 Tax=uncultured Pigmentiphaga sp. TaxID=340361 RepID=UPI002612181D|nr:hypothetical protein [uncultured Pigmentiphaga sp.]